MEHQRVVEPPHVPQLGDIREWAVVVRGRFGTEGARDGIGIAPVEDRVHEGIDRGRRAAAHRRDDGEKRRSVCEVEVQFRRGILERGATPRAPTEVNRIEHPNAGLVRVP